MSTAADDEKVLLEAERVSLQVLDINDDSVDDSQGAVLATLKLRDFQQLNVRRRHRRRGGHRSQRGADRNWQQLPAIQES